MKIIFYGQYGNYFRLWQNYTWSTTNAYLRENSNKTKEVNSMQLSARNQLKGRISDIKNGPVSTEVVIDINGVELVATITTGSSSSMDLKVGDEVTAVVKASSVMVGK